MRSAQIRGVVFDVDGVLFDTERLPLTAEEYALLRRLVLLCFI